MTGKKTTIRLIAFVELLIGLSTLFGLITYSLLLISKKPLNVFIFVLLSSVISIIIGLGLLNYREWSRIFLVFFSGYVILTKILVLANVLYFKGEIITFFPGDLKNYISIIYHCFITLFFTQQTVKDQFIKNESRT